MGNWVALVTTQKSATGIDLSVDLLTSLVERGLIEAERVEQIATLKSGSSQRLGKLLVDTGLLNMDALYRFYSDYYEFALWDGEGEPTLDERLPESFLSYNRILPVRREEQLTLAIEDPEDDGLLDMLRRLLPDARIELAPPQKLSQPLNALLGAGDQESNRNELSVDDISHLKDLALEAPIIRQVNDLIGEGVDMGASDIHLEPAKSRIDLRYRIDGVLITRAAPSLENYPAIVSRIKILASLDIAERRLPQDGRIRLRTGGREVDIRVSTLPTNHGEDVVMRILDQKSQALSLDATGLSERIVDTYRENLSRSSGLILVTGPTGSGKSTTLYSGLNAIIDGTRKIITVEDPVEYEISGITQIQVNEGAGLTFAGVLRSILRHDPDVIFIGEIRDRETAEIAVQASLTGHLVLSTIHTNSATGAIGRFLDMGVADYLLASSLIAVSAQRLVRKLCEHCKVPGVPDLGAVERFGLPPDALVFHPKGCQKCSRTGYRGRLPIGEMLELTPEFRHQILHNPAADNLDQFAHGMNFTTMLHDGIARVLQGETTLEEIVRVAG
jgi:general secretion pathway protein E